MALKVPFAPLRSLGFIALFTMALIILVQYAAAWYGLEVVKESKENEFNRHLSDVGKIAQPLLREPSIDIAEIAVQSTDPSSIPDEAERASRFLAQIGPELREPFQEFADRTRLKRLLLIDTRGRVLLNTGDPNRVFVPFEFLDIDRDKFELALVGQIAESLTYSVETETIKRVYVPIREMAGGSVAAVLCITAGPDYLGALDRLAQNMRILSAVSTVLVLVIGLIVYRLLVRQQRYEQQAAHADRLKSLGALAAGFAHEVRNPLEIIRACTEDLERTLIESPSAPPVAAEACRDVLEEVDRLNWLVGQFLQYSRGDEARPEAESAGAVECITSAVSMLRHTGEKKGVSIVWKAPEQRAGISPSEVKLAESSLRQIVINLVLNAIQATPAGGRVELIAEQTPKMFRLSVYDTGPGVSANIRARVFDPFFTTREEGSGLGLAIAHQLASRAGGRLVCEERPLGAGACFVLELPRAAMARAAQPAGVAQASPRPNPSGELV
jgi:signal transduction histidine kinase